MNISLIITALNQCEVLIRRNGATPTLVSIRGQLSYLKQLAEGETSDLTRIKDIVMGVQAAREIEQLDEAFALNIYTICADLPGTKV